MRRVIRRIFSLERLTLLGEIPSPGGVSYVLLLSPDVLAEPLVVVLHHGTLLFGLVDGVAETLVEDQLHRNLAVLERLKPDTDFMPTDCSMLGTAALTAAQKRRATESCRRMEEL